MNEESGSRGSGVRGQESGDVGAGLTKGFVEEQTESINPPVPESGDVEAGLTKRSVGEQIESINSPALETEDIEANNEESLKTLIRAIRLSQGGFSPILVRCNYARLRERVVQELREKCPIKIHELVLDTSVKTLFTTIEKALNGEQPQALMVLGLELVDALDRVIVATNQVREEFRKTFPFPLVLWVNDRILRKFIRLAPDFESWTTLIEFAIATDELVELIRDKVEQIFSDRLIVPRWICSAIHLDDCSELETACQELQRRGADLEPELEASLEFVRGLDDYVKTQLDAALEHYQKSLAFWQECNQLERQGRLLINIALCYYRKAEKYRTESQNYWEESRNYLQQAIAVFEQAQRPDLVAYHISKLAEFLRRLQYWDELQTLAQKSLTLHQTYNNPSQLAQDYGCLAEVALAQSRWDEASQLARQALQILSAIPNKPTDEGGLYWFILGQAQEQLCHVQEAIISLENARQENNPQYDPPLYINILKKLRSLYFQQRDYLKAFEIKQEQQSIEAQYGFRPFVGAGSLRPIKQAIDPTLEPVEFQERARERITASGRRQDISHLIERLSRNDYTLIVIHGQSGVGKSSLLRAGLVPELKQNPIGDRTALPVTLRYYTNWVKDLGTRLVEAMVEMGIGERVNAPSLDSPLDSIEAIIEQLKKNSDRNLLTVLIFDQFEEFFFVCTDLKERLKFYDFLRVCLNLPYVKVILSLREDYLHYLLECDRLTNLDSINNNILDKNIRYYLGDFLQERAKAVILELTEQSRFYLQPELIDELVRDLAGELGEVRPIELQVIGAQLQTENITTLEQYRQLGANPKEKLVQRSLECVIQDCGAENERAARLALYLLTNENYTRPLKTHAELEADLTLLGFESETEQLDLALEVLVGSGLVFQIPESPANRYQLVHDYLVAFIRQQQAPGLLAELAEAKEKQKLTEAQLREALKEKEEALRQEQQQRQRAEIAEIEALNSLSQALWLSHDQLDALVALVKAGKKLQAIGMSSENKARTASRLYQTLDQVREYNRFEEHSSGVMSVSFSPDSQMLASASTDSTVKLWRVDGTLVQTLKGHFTGVTSVSFSPDGQTLASASYDGTVKLWHVDGTLLQTLKGHSDLVRSVSFSPDGQTLASASYDRRVKLWRMDGTLVQTFEGHSKGVWSVSFSPDGQMLASASSDGTVKLWRVDGTLMLAGRRKTESRKGFLTLLRDFYRTAPVQTFEERSSGVMSVSFSPDGQTLASASTDGTVKLWHVNGTLVQTLKGHSYLVNSVSFNPDGQTLASASYDGTVKLWHVNGTLMQTLKGHSYLVNSVSFSPDGQTLASASDDGTVKLWRVDGALVQTFQGHGAGVTSASFSQDDQTFASASEHNTVKLRKLLPLEDLVRSGCNWLRDYLKTNPNVSESDRTLCDDICTQE